MRSSTLAVTFFVDCAAATKVEEQVTLSDLAERIRTAAAPEKSALPWLKLARFGGRRTPKGSLRHDTNLLAISGIEADYDAGEMGAEAAAELLEQQGILAIVYTSPSHTDDAPHWRVLCPLSEEMPPGRRPHQLGRLNGLFRGTFAPESWTSSQAYYFGSVRENPSHCVKLIGGTTIDQHDDLDEMWIGKPGRANRAANTDQAAAMADAREDAELIRRVVTGEGLHAEMCALAARYIGRGLSADTTAEVLRGLLLSFPLAARDERWADRFHSIDPLVASAKGKYAAAAEYRRALARTALRLIRQRQPCDDVRVAVRAEAASLGIEGGHAERIVAWAARQELARRKAANG